jgi:hypothetical protein
MLTERALKAAARRAIQLIEERGFRQGKRGPGLCVGDAIAEADPKKKCRWTLWVRAESVIRGRDTGTSSDPNSPGYQVGWLAREIQQHDFYRAREEEEEIKERIEWAEALEWSRG